MCLHESILTLLEVIFPRFKILVCAVYRSPGAVNNFWGNFHISVERAFESSPRIIITGDLNVNLLIERKLPSLKPYYNYF